ncbi:MAG: FkbM family methyltransferase [Candidatus Micrarchaeota archaeon]
MIRFIINLLFLKKKNLSKSKKLDLLIQYIIIYVKYLIKYKLLKKRHADEQLWDKKIHVVEYAAFVRLFEEIFIKNEYYFKSKNDAPRIIDCGSNIGISVIYFKYLYPKSRILCFEPSPQNFDILEKNVDENKLKNITLINAAVHAKKTKLNFFNNSVGGGVTSQVVRANSLFSKESIVEVDAVRLSEYISKPVDLLKLDVEGSEFDVLKDLVRTGKIKLIRNAIIEYHHHQYYKAANLASFLHFLEDNNFEYMISARTYGAFEKSGSQAIMIYMSQAASHRLSIFSETF